MKICIAQCQSGQGQIKSSLANHINIIKKAITHQADLIVFPELSITGYEPRLAKDLATSIDDKLFNPLQLLSLENNISIGIGMPTISRKGIHISTIVFQPEQKKPFVYSKQQLHKDELPYFESAREQSILKIKDSKIALGICYETLQREHFMHAKENNADLFIASVAKAEQNTEKAFAHFPRMAKEFKMPILMANSVGYCDHFMSNGKSAIWNHVGENIVALNSSDQGILVYDTIVCLAEIEYI